MMLGEVHHSNSHVLLDEYQWNLVVCSGPVIVRLAPIWLVNDVY